MPRWTFGITKAGYRKMWKSAVIKPGADAINAKRVAQNIIKHEQRYRAVQKLTGVPWYFTGALHYRESSNDFRGVLHNGQRIIGTGRKTTIVPKGRGPFSTWEEAAVDALTVKPHRLNLVKSWPIERMGYEAERYNGLGYMYKGINSPYVWAGTNHEQSGAYVRDHVFDRNKDDPRVGVMAILKAMCELRPDVARDIAKPGKPPVEETGGTIAVGGGAAIAAYEAGAPWWVFVIIAAVVVAGLGFFIWKRRNP